MCAIVNTLLLSISQVTIVKVKMKTFHSVEFATILVLEVALFPFRITGYPQDAAEPKGKTNMSIYSTICQNVILTEYSFSFQLCSNPLAASSSPVCSS